MSAEVLRAMADDVAALAKTFSAGWVGHPIADRIVARLREVADSGAVDLTFDRPGDLGACIDMAIEAAVRRQLAEALRPGGMLGSVGKPHG